MALLTCWTATTPSRSASARWSGERAVEPGDVLAPRRAPRRAHGRPQVHRPAGHLAALGDGAREPRRGGARPTGIGFDGSSIRGFQEIYESDMLLLPDPSTAILDPFYEAPTLSLVCTCSTRSRASRTRATRATSRDQGARSTCAASGIADTAYFGPEAEFYVFDHVAFDQQANTRVLRGRLRGGPLELGAGLPAARRGAGRTSATRNRSQQGYFPAPPNDTLSDLRGRMVLVLEALGHPRPRVHHHEVGGPGQAEIDLRFLPLLEWPTRCSCTSTSSRTPPGRRARRRRSCPSRSSRRTAPGMHVAPVAVEGRRDAHVRRGRLRAAVGRWRCHYVGRPARARAGAAGVLRADDQLLPRLVPGYEAPVLLKHSQRNRSAAVRIPMYFAVAEGQARRVPPARPARQPLPRVRGDAHGGPGRHRARARPRRADRHATSTSCRRSAWRRSRTVPTSLDEALDALEADHAFLTRGDVFTDDLIATYVEFRREQSDRVKIRPHPYEFPHVLRRLGESHGSRRARRSQRRAAGRRCVPRRRVVQRAAHRGCRRDRQDDGVAGRPAACPRARAPRLRDATARRRPCPFLHRPHRPPRGRVRRGGRGPAAAAAAGARGRARA